MVERYEVTGLDADVAPSPFERASSHGALPRSSSVEQASSEAAHASYSGELARRRLPGHKRASSLSDLSRSVLSRHLGLYSQGSCQHGWHAAPLPWLSGPLQIRLIRSKRTCPRPTRQRSQQRQPVSLAGILWLQTHVHRE